MPINLECFRPYINRAGELATLLGSESTTTFHLLAAIVDLAQDELRSRLRSDVTLDILIEIYNLGGVSAEHPSLIRQVLAAGLRARSRASGSHDEGIYLLMGILALPLCLGHQVIQSLQVRIKPLQSQLAQIVGLTTQVSRHRPAGTPSLLDISPSASAPIHQVAPEPLRPLRLGSSSVLAQIGKDLTLLASKGKIDPVIGRDKEIKKAIRVLLKRKKNNPVFIGEAGVGKTAVVEGLASAIVEQTGVPEKLRGKRIFSLSLTNLTAGTQYRGQFEQKFQRLLKEISDHPEIIVFIDELHTVLGAGSSEGGLNAAHILKPALARGEFPCIGASTLDEYRKYIEKDAALERRFQPILIEEPTEKVTLQILQGLRKKYEEYHHVTYTDAALLAAVRLTARYIHERNFPDKAIDVLDEAGSREVVAADGNPVIDEKDIARVVSEWSGVPVSTSQEYHQRLLALKDELLRYIIGQDQAVSLIAERLLSVKMGKQPIGSFVFLGPTGVGKTEVARKLALLLFGSEDSLIKYDMSEYQEKHQVSRLIGSPPGYVGYDEGGKLVNDIRHKPYAVVLFDEIEKAHRDIFDILLQVLEDGVLTDNQGRKAHFENTVIIMTTNVIPATKKSIGFTKNDEIGDVNVLHQALLERGFRLEFINRVDEIVLFHSLIRDNMKDILELRLYEIVEQVKIDYDISLEFTENVKTMLIEKGFSAKLGARELKRVVRRIVLAPLGRKIARQEFGNGDQIKIIKRSDQIIFQKISTKGDK